MIAWIKARGRSVSLVLALLVAGLTGEQAVAQGGAQYPAGQYQPGQYQPGQYPAAQYPAGQYPSAQYPARPYSPPPAPAPQVDGDLNHGARAGQDAMADPTANPRYATYASGGNAYGQGAPPPAPRAQTYHQDDLIGAAEGVFGKGAHGLADVLHDILRKQGEPIGYITGREAGGAFAVGLRYGSGTLFHKTQGTRPVYWTGPSIGFDVGGNADKAFVLVYNLYDVEDLFRRYGAGEGQAYLVGGFHVSYLRRGDVVLIPVRMGVGLRLGINGGYMKFSRRQNWMPF